MLWIKALHIAFVVCWFAGIFYLPRLFVNSAQTSDRNTLQTLAVMQRKLYRFMSLLAILAVLLGLLLLGQNWAYYSAQGWMQVKLVLVVLLIGYHLACGRYVHGFEQNKVKHSHIYFRWFNELPVLMLFSIVILAVVRPF